MQTDGEDDEAQEAPKGKSYMEKENYELTSDYNETLIADQNLENISIFDKKDIAPKRFDQRYRKDSKREQEVSTGLSNYATILEKKKMKRKRVSCDETNTKRASNRVSVDRSKQTQMMSVAMKKFKIKSPSISSPYSIEPVLYARPKEFGYGINNYAGYNAKNSIGVSSEMNLLGLRNLYQPGAGGFQQRRYKSTKRG